MKVCTDACLFGAWVGNHLKNEGIPGDLVLDIGTGTGLLSLILSQALKVNIDAVEIEENAFRQASENFAQSPWHRTITAIHKNISEFIPNGKYGLIITNPPFFENDLKTQSKEKNLARHEASLHLAQIFAYASEWMLPGAYLALLLPAFRGQQANEYAIANGLFLCNEEYVRQTNNHEPFRVMLLYRNISSRSLHSTIAIKDNSSYTPEFKELLAPYYLNL